MVTCASLFLVSLSYMSVVWGQFGGITTEVSHLLPNLGTINWLKTGGGVVVVVPALWKVEGKA